MSHRLDNPLIWLCRCDYGPPLRNRKVPQTQPPSVWRLLESTQGNWNPRNSWSTPNSGQALAIPHRFCQNFVSRQCSARNDFAMVVLSAPIRSHPWFTIPFSRPSSCRHKKRIQPRMGKDSTDTPPSCPAALHSPKELLHRVIFFASFAPSRLIVSDSLGWPGPPAH